MHIKIINGTPFRYSPEQVRVDNPGISFPSVLTDATLAEFDIYPCQTTEKPAYDYTKNVAEIFEQVNEQWVQTWQITDASEEEIAQRTTDKANKIRVERNQRLSATDWRFRSDLTPSSGWIEYCQALRDIPEQPGFPWNVIWPEEPA